MAGSDPIAPWSFFQDPASVSVLDDNAWKLLGFGPTVQAGSSGFQFGNFKHVPSAVTTSPNLLMLEDEAKHPFAYTRGAALHRLNGIGAFHPENVPTPPTNGGASSTGSALNTGSGQSPVSASDLQKLITCFTNSKWSMEWCGVVCYLDSACAQTIQTILWGGTAATLAAGVAAGIASFVASHAIGTAVSAALAVYGGWVGMAVLLSAFYWALMILLNMTPRGVCLHIPGPWTFGLLGPGWAVGV